MRKPGGVLITGMFGIIFFLIIVGVLNIVAGFIVNGEFLSIVGFINENLALILGISIIMLLGDVFSTFKFPINTIYPWINAFGAILWVVFIFRVLRFIDALAELNLSEIFRPFYLVAILAVLVIVPILGYVNILAKVDKKKRKKKLEWEDVGEEFKEAAFNIGRTLKESFKPKK